MPSPSAWKVLVFACGLLAWSAASCASGSNAGSRPASSGGRAAGGSQASAGATAGRAAEAGAGGTRALAGRNAAGSSGARAAASGNGAGKSGGTSGTSGASGSGGTSQGSGTRWAPKLGDSFQYQLTGKLDTGIDADIFDIDLYETSASDIDALHARDRKVVCYFDTAYEPYRPDAKQLEPYRGSPIEGWPGQYWVDIREPAVLTVMLARLDMAQSKHCDGVEGDDVDARNNKPGFPITAADQQGFIRKLAQAAHARGMAYGLKNDLDDVDALLPDVDFEVNEECFEYEECETLAPFIRAGKPVFNVEYTEGDLAEKAKRICPEAKRLGLTSMIKHIDLDAARYACP